MTNAPLLKMRSFFPATEVALHDVVARRAISESLDNLAATPQLSGDAESVATLRILARTALNGQPMLKGPMAEDFQRIMIGKTRGHSSEVSAETILQDIATALGAGNWQAVKVMQRLIDLGETACKIKGRLETHTDELAYETGVFAADALVIFQGVVARNEATPDLCKKILAGWDKLTPRMVTRDPDLIDREQARGIFQVLADTGTSWGMQAFTALCNRVDAVLWRLGEKFLPQPQPIQPRPVARMVGHLQVIVNPNPPLASALPARPGQPVPLKVVGVA